MHRAMRFLGWMLVIPLALSAAAGAPQAVAPDPGDLAGFIDGIMEAQRKAHHFAGVVVVVVHDGQVALQKGYGYADFAERRPVDPQRTLFRIASNSKMFVWTAVMQLVEDGKLDLRAAVTDFLSHYHAERNHQGLGNRLIEPGEEVGVMARFFRLLPPISQFSRGQFSRDLMVFFLCRDVIAKAT